MGIITPTSTSTWTRTNQVCIYWRQGRCNRNPCRFLHRETHEQQPQPPIEKRTRTWRNSDNGDSVSKRKINVSNAQAKPQPKQCNAQLKQLNANAQPNQLNSNAQPNQLINAEPKQCKYWTTDNCVHGEEKCKDLHSWFSGSGFTMLAKLEGHTKPITGFSLPSGRDKLYSSSNDGSLRAWDCNTGKCASSIGIGAKVGCLAGEGAWLYAGLENEVKAWNFQNETEYSLNFNGAVGSVCSMVVDEDLVFAGMENGTIKVWRWNSESKIHEPAHVLKGHDGAVCSLVIGRGRLYSGSRDSTIKAWELQTMQCLQTLHGHSRDVTSVLCWSNYLLSASLDKTLKIWRATETGAVEVTHEIKHDHELMALCGILDAQEKPILLCSFSDSTVRLYDLPSFTERGRIFSKRPVQVIQIGTDGLFFTGDATGDVSVWKLLG